MPGRKVDSLVCLRTTPQASSLHAPHLADTYKRFNHPQLDDWFKKNGQKRLIIATGFIAKNPQGQATTLRRNGSDFSATIMGALFRSGHITIWTDVDGVYSADPRKVVCVCVLQSKQGTSWVHGTLAHKQGVLEGGRGWHSPWHGVCLREGGSTGTVIVHT